MVTREEERDSMEETERQELINKLADMKIEFDQADLPEEGRVVSIYHSDEEMTREASLILGMVLDQINDTFSNNEQTHIVNHANV